MNLRYFYIAIALLIMNLLPLASSAQRNYPIRTTVQYTPPYSLFLGDFATPKIIVTLTGQDLLDANCPYKLSISLECQNVKVTTKPSFNPVPLYISGGQTIVLTGADLASYFDIQNLDFHGITAAKYLQDGQLPEGFYRMTVKVIHYHENRVISNTAFTMFNARMGKPPVLSLPKNNALIPPAQQQSPIVFSWVPKTVGAFNYIFELWECAVPGIPVQTVVSTIKPIFTQTYTTSQISFQPATVNMKPGMQYAWRITVEDPLNQQKFANQGQSEIFTFTYKRKPEPVTGLKFTNRGLKITWTWDMNPAHTKYYFEYYDPQTGRTIDPVACDYAEFVRNMPKSGYHLKARVRAESYGDPTLMSDYTPYLDTYLEPIPVPEYECGKVFEDREITNLELKHTFAPGEIVESKNGDTRYEIIFSEEKNGYLSGQFYMIMDCWGGAKIKCEFSKTQINTDNIVLNTIFHNVPDSTLYIKPETIRKEIQEAFFDAATVLTDFSINDTVKLDKPYTYLYVNESGKVVAVSVNNNGKTEEKTTEISATNLKENTLIQGKNGEELVLTKKGQVMGKTEFNATGGNSVLLKEYHRKSDSLAQWQINFSKSDAQTYAFDHIGSGNHGIFSGADYYPQSGSYDFRYKSVECGKFDKVKVEFGAYPQADSVVFKDKYGVTYPIKDRILTFTGVSKADTNFIYAYRGDQKIGKLFLNTYQQKTYKVVLISVNKAKLPNKTDLQKYLNNVYNQCAVSFEIEVKDLQVSGIENFTHGGTKVAGSVWNASQKAVLEAFGEKYEDNTAYLFFIPKAETGGVAGYMPRYYPYGFIYPGAANRTIAHELGHGIAGLEHPFPESQVSGSTQNLMDYRDGTELWHFQWNMLQDPARKIFKWWQNEEGAEAVIKRIAERDDYITDDNGYAVFLAPSGLPITIKPEGNITIVNSSEESLLEFLNKGEKDLFADYPVGTLISFTENGRTYIAIFDESNAYFKGYFDNVHNQYKIDKITPTYTPPYQINKIEENIFYLEDYDRYINIDDFGGIYKAQQIAPIMEEALQTNYAQTFYRTQIETIGESYQTIVYHIAKTIDDFLITSDRVGTVLGVDVIGTEILPNDYYKYEWSQEDYSRLYRFLMNYDRTKSVEDAHVLSVTYEDRKVGFCQEASDDYVGYIQNYIQKKDYYTLDGEINRIKAYFHILKLLFTDNNNSDQINSLTTDILTEFRSFTESIDVVDLIGTLLFVEDESFMERSHNKNVFDHILTNKNSTIRGLLYKLYFALYDQKYYDVITGLPPARELLSDVDFYDINSDLSCDDLLNFMIYANKSYKYSDFYYSHIPQVVRFALIGKLVKCSLDNEQKNAVVRLIETVLVSEVKDMPDFLNDLPCDGVLQFLIYANESALCEDVFWGNIPINIRLNWIKKITECSLFNDDEKIVINLIKSTPEKDAERLLDFLFNSREKTENYFEQFRSSIDGDNYVLYLIALCEKWKLVHNSEIQKVQKDYPKYADNYFIWSEAALYEIDYSMSINDNLISITTTYTYPEIAGDDVFRRTYTECSHTNYSYDDVIILKLRTIPDFFFNTVSHNSKSLRGADIIMPAFLFLSINEKTNKDYWIDRIDLFVTVVSFVWGIGELKTFASLSRGQKFLSILGLGMDGYSILTKNSTINTWMEETFFPFLVTENPELGGTIKRIWETLINVYDLQGIVSIKSLNKKVKSDFDAFKVAWAAFKQFYYIDFNPTDKETIQNIDNILEIVKLKLDIANE